MDAILRIDPKTISPLASNQAEAEAVGPTHLAAVLEGVAQVSRFEILTASANQNGEAATRCVLAEYMRTDNPSTTTGLREKYCALLFLAQYAHHHRLRRGGRRCFRPSFAVSGNDPSLWWFFTQVKAELSRGPTDAMGRAVRKWQLRRCI
jgi:hypothetical protein